MKISLNTISEIQTPEVLEKLNHLARNYFTDSRVLSEKNRCYACPSVPNDRMMFTQRELFRLIQRVSRKSLTKYFQSLSLPFESVLSVLNRSELLHCIDMLREGKSEKEVVESLSPWDIYRLIRGVKGNQMRFFRWYITQEKGKDIFNY